MDAAVSPAVAPPLYYPSALVDRIVLADGRSLVVRPVGAHDAEAEQAFVRALSPDSRRRRFHVGLAELPTWLLRAMTEVDQLGHVAVVAESLDEDDRPTIVADARYVFGERPGEAEFALAVADEWQGLGVGRDLLRRLLRYAARRGIAELYGDVLHGNLPMLGLVRSLGGHFEPSPGDATLRRARFMLQRSCPPS
jgi:acetyltransferase